MSEIIYTIVFLTGASLGLAAMIAYIRKQLTIYIVPVGPEGPTGYTGADSPDIVTGPAGLIGPTGQNNVLGPTGSRGAIPGPAVALTQVYYEQDGATGTFNSMNNGIIPLGNVDSGGRVTRASANNLSVMNCRLDTPGYLSTIVFLRPSVTPTTWVKGIAVYTANFTIPQLDRSFIFSVGYSPESSAPLADITQIAAIGIVTDTTSFATFPTQICITLPFTAQIPSGIGNLNFFAYLDFTKTQMPLTAQITSYSYSIEIATLP